RLKREGKGKLIKGQQENKELSTRGRRGDRTSTAPLCTPEQKQDSDDDFPARRTRSRSSSCNSVNSERSASSANTPVSRGRGRGRGTSRTSQQPNVTITRKDNKQRTVAEEVFTRRRTTAQDSNSASPSEHLLRSTALKSEISRRSTNSQNRGKGYSQRGRGRKTEALPDAVTPVSSDKNSAPTATLRGRRSKKSEGSSLTLLLHEDNEEANSKMCSTTRGQKRANTNGSESTAANEEDQPNQEGESSSEALLMLRTNNRGRKVVKRNSLATQSLVTTASQEDEAKESRRGRKRDLVEEAGTLVSTPKKSRGNVKAQKGKMVLEDSDEKEEIPVSVQAKRRGRPAGKSANESSQKVEVKEESDKMEEDTVVRRARGRLSMLHKKKKQEPEDSSSMEQDTNLEASEQSQTPSSSVSRKRRESVDSSPLAKIPCSSPASRLRAASPVCRFCVLFTGVVDDAWERVVVHLGGIIAKDVADMSFLVTDKIRRTVKFLCAVAKGVPIVTPQWLEKSGKAESFLSPNAFIVKDLEQEKKFNFCLKESLRIASRQPLLQGYEIHVTKSVKPEPVHMKDIISCSGATFLPKMPSSHKPQSVVISCEEDWALCAPAVSASLPVVTAEFILTGILQQKVDFQTHTLSAPPSNPQPAGGRGRARKKP
ncbi:mediator of DNA damage checkpoint protein 1, partial [Thalassophryne amazonica]|uniref:mediator of DNA damage checkpoint protein 1 n=1 Tax=Thalassophryne amazonica TaxID=390379 RepID=UPI00147242B5